MITSLVRLPEYGANGVVISGTKFGGIYSTAMMCDPINNMFVSGRELRGIHGLFKYKMDVDCSAVGRIYSIIFITDTDLEIGKRNLNDLQMIEIFPIYAREVALEGYNTPLRSNVILNLRGINRLFGRIMMLPEVCTIVDAFSHMRKIGTQVTHPSIEAKLRNVHCDLATLYPITSEIGDKYMVGGDDMSRYELDMTIEYGCIKAGYLPQIVTTLLCAHYIGEIIKFLDQHYLDSMINMAVRQSEVDQAQYYEYIHLCDDECPRYVFKDDFDCMDAMLFYSAMLPRADFKVACVPTVAESGTLFNPSTMSAAPMTSYDKISKFSRAVLDVFNGGGSWANSLSLDAAGSYLEDIWFYNKANELSAYVDLVWWILAAGGGLLNAKNVFI